MNFRVTRPKHIALAQAENLLKLDRWPPNQTHQKHGPRLIPEDTSQWGQSYLNLLWVGMGAPLGVGGPCSAYWVVVYQSHRNKENPGSYFPAVCAIDLAGPSSPERPVCCTVDTVQLFSLAITSSDTCLIFFFRKKILFRIMEGCFYMWTPLGPTQDLVVCTEK